MASTTISKKQAFFNAFSAKLVEMGVVSQENCDIIARRGTRKEYLWNRHIIDLANFAIDQNKQREEPCKEIEQLCNRTLEWCKQKQ